MHRPAAAPGSFPVSISPSEPAEGSSLPQAPGVGPSPGRSHGSNAAPVSPFVLTPHRDDTGLFQDWRIGFSHLVPGRPRLGPANVRPQQPPADAVLHLQDAPIVVRYRVEAPFFAAPTQADLARATVERYGSWRAGRAVAADRANETWLACWGVEAAAVAAYDVPPSPAHRSGTAREELFVLVRHGIVLLVSWAYPRDLVDDVIAAAFTSVAEATLVWDSVRWEQRGRVWPQSEWLESSLAVVTKPRLRERAKALGGTPLLPDERARLLAVLAGFVAGAGAPWVPLAPGVIESSRQGLLAVIRSAPIRAFVEEVFAEIRTAHDLRGFAIVLRQALDDRPMAAFPEKTAAVGATREPPTR